MGFEKACHAPPAVSSVCRCLVYIREHLKFKIPLYPLCTLLLQLLMLLSAVLSILSVALEVRGMTYSVPVQTFPHRAEGTGLRGRCFFLRLHIRLFLTGLCRWRHRYSLPLPVLYIHRTHSSCQVKDLDSCTSRYDTMLLFTTHVRIIWSALTLPGRRAPLPPTRL